MYTSRPQVMERHFPLRDLAEISDLEADMGEKHDVAGEHPDVVKRLTKLAGAFDRRCGQTGGPRRLFRRRRLQGVHEVTAIERACDRSAAPAGGQEPAARSIRIRRL